MSVNSKPTASQKMWQNYLNFFPIIAGIIDDSD